MRENNLSTIYHTYNLLCPFLRPLPSYTPNGLVSEPRRVCHHENFRQHFPNLSLAPSVPTPPPPSPHLTPYIVPNANKRDRVPYERSYASGLQNEAGAVHSFKHFRAHTPT